MPDVAVLGTGLLGAGFVEGFRKRGVSVRIWNRTASKARALAGPGVEVASDPAAAVAGVERVHLILGDDTSVEAVLSAAGSALDGVTVIDHSTVSPAGVVARVARRGNRYVHAPVFMAPVNAREATGLMLVAGPAPVVDPLLPVLAPMTGRVWHVGARVDLAAAYKLFGNSMLFTMVAGVADVLTMARELGIDGSDAINVFKEFDPSPVIRSRGGRMARGQYGPASFELTMARKDARLMEEVGGRELFVLPAIAARMEALIAAGYGLEDLAALGRPKD